MHCAGWSVWCLAHFPVLSNWALCGFCMCFCLSLWSLSCHQLASCVNIFPFSAQLLSLHLLQRWSDSQFSVMWQPCHSDEWLSSEAECRCEMSTRAAPKSKRTVRLARPRIPTVSSDHCSAEAAEEIKGENIRQKEEQHTNQAWWKGAARGLGLMSLTSPHGLQGRTPLKWVNFAPVITAQTQQSQIFLSISHRHFKSLRKSWLTEDIVLKWAASLPSFFLLPIKRSQSHSLMAFTNGKTEQLWHENIYKNQLFLQDSQKSKQRWKSERTDLGRGRFYMLYSKKKGYKSFFF